MARMVLLEHVLRSGERHFDWLLERPGEPEGPLLAFRVFERVDAPRGEGVEGGVYRAERMKDHRRVYLEFEGELTGGRGDVRRVAAGDVESLGEGDGLVRASVRWEGEVSVARWRGEADEGDRWWFEREG